jgi:hypothetical protein
VPCRSFSIGDDLQTSLGFLELLVGFRKGLKGEYFDWSRSKIALWIQSGLLSSFDNGLKMDGPRCTVSAGFFYTCNTGDDEEVGTIVEHFTFG